MSKNVVQSPCISICALDDEDVCVGCHRTVTEIREWALMDDDEKYQVLEKSAERARIKNPFM